MSKMIGYYKSLQVASNFARICIILMARVYMKLTNFINSRYSLILIAIVQENNLNRSALRAVFWLSTTVRASKGANFQHIHCNLSLVCPPTNMASETVRRSIVLVSEHSLESSFNWVFKITQTRSASVNYHV